MPELVGHRPASWWVLHTRARNEKAVADRLDREGVSYYLPLVESRRTRRWRREAYQVPLFPGYLFLLGERRDCDVAWRTRRVANILPVDDQTRLEHELEQIRRLIASDAPVDLYPALRVGRMVRITHGALRGLEGVVVRRRGMCRVFLAVTFVGQSAVVEVDSASVEASGPDPAAGATA
jgi:transcription antitermination factor NusG